MTATVSSGVGPARRSVEPDPALVGALTFTDEELSAQALAADPDGPADPDAVPFAAAGGAFPTLLPDWYMPTPVARVRTRGHAVVVALVIAGFVLINACGFCITYGHLVVG
jgi:hypothetical protein